MVLLLLLHASLELNVHYFARSFLVDRGHIRIHDTTQPASLEQQMYTFI
jgi:hypothetical protein